MFTLKHFIITTLSIVFLVSALLVLSACGGGDSAKPSPIVEKTTEQSTDTDQGEEQDPEKEPEKEKEEEPVCETQATLAENHFDTEYSYHNPQASTVKDQLLTSFIVKESAGVAAVNYPVSMVFPLPPGEHFYAGEFHIKNDEGVVIPAQFNVLNRWWAKDRSLRHVQAHFTIDLPVYTTGKPDTGSKRFYLHAGKADAVAKNSVCTVETDEEISISNGLITLNIQKNPLIITTPAGQLTSLFTTEKGIVDKSFNHKDIKIELDELGAQRTVVKISSQTDYMSPTDIKHGWALRLYIHANSHLVKTDFQLQNSALNTVFSAPLYYKSHQLRLDGVGATTTAELKADNLERERITSQGAGYIGSPKVAVFMRDFWQRFPNGLQVNDDGSLDVELYPAWSKQYLNNDFVNGDYYWLDDMKQTYKELLFDFSEQKTDEDITRTSLHFQYPPVAIIPQSYYQKTSVTLELGGYFPLTEPETELARLPQYSDKDFSPLHGAYRFGQDNFGIDLARKLATSGTGGWPYSNRKFFISGNPKDYYFAQNMAKAEINIRPQWLSGYTHDDDFDNVMPTTNPYAGNTWRKFLGHGVATLTRSYIEDSKRVAKPRDDQHAWFYHVEQAYLMSGNKWLKDWYEFMAEFKQAYIQELDPWPDRSNRAEGHSLSVALSSYRVTDNKKLGQLLKNYTSTIHSKYVLAPHNISVGTIKLTNPKAAVFQQGFLVKVFIDLYNEFPDQEVTLNLIHNHVEWNYLYANYSYYRSVVDYQVNTKASGSSLSFVDAAIWYSLYVENPKYADHAIHFVQYGIGGNKPYGSWDKWQGQYEAQLYNYYLQKHNRASD
ncbi:hypothetical protein KO495_15280 [Colwellia sp. D2M02]|uniref:hypothetical protein n=1 Tax=Colwellia sp. D2M02 TaxID=2841562 RepID=UPI001C09D8AE|nr:hypothetical protein [Colwellia sp. D2M02]MBU2894673.1 hypothetical protein [Colwellia sp. D2M02]